VESEKLNIRCVSFRVEREPEGVAVLFRAGLEAVEAERFGPLKDGIFSESSGITGCLPAKSSLGI